MVIKFVNDCLQLPLALCRMSAEAFEDIDAQRLVALVMFEKRPHRDAKELRAIVIATEGNVSHLHQRLLDGGEDLILVGTESRVKRKAHKRIRETVAVRQFASVMLRLVELRRMERQVMEDRQDVPQLKWL